MIRDKTDLTISDRIAQRVRDLRADRGMSLGALAARCGVSRSMISLIERGETSPTAVVLEKLATGLNVTLASLFEPVHAASDPVARLAQQALWRDPHSGYVRRNVSPLSANAISGTRLASPIQIVEVSFPANARVAYENGAREAQVHQQIWILEGAMQITVGDEDYRLNCGDCLALVLDRPVTFYNATGELARYAVVITKLPFSAR